MLRKVTYKILLVFETILNYMVLFLVLLVVSVLATFQAYSESMRVLDYQSIVNKLYMYLPIAYVYIVFFGGSITTVKMLINSNPNARVSSFISGVIPALSSVILILGLSPSTDFLIDLFGSATLEMDRAVTFYTLTISVLLGIIIRKVVNYNAGFYEITETSGYNDIASKYFTGSTRNVDLDEVSKIASKYERSK